MSEVKPSLPHVIDPHGVYTVESARAALGLAKSCLAREIRLARLRASKRAGRHFILGAWLLEWIEAGEVSRRKRQAPTEVKGFADQECN